MTNGSAPAASGWNRLGDQIEKRGWLLSVVWLVFLIFPVIAVWTDPVALWRKLAITTLIAAFSFTYVHGFKTMDDAGKRGDSSLTRRPPVTDSGFDTQEDFSDIAAPWWASHPGSVAHYVVLVALTTAALALGGWGMLGMLAFVVVYANFNLAWPAAAATVVVALAATLVGPALQGFLDDVWFFAIMVGTLAVFTAMIRLAEEREAERSQFRTQLVVSDERARVARDVHDVLGHSLTVVTLKAELCQRLLQMVPDDPDALDQCRQEVAELQATSRQAMAEIRTTVGGLRQTDLADELSAARLVLSDAGVNLTVTGDHSHLETDQRNLLAWVVRESVTNIVRHAEAKSCIIAFDPEAGPEDQATPPPAMRITDDGKGLNGRPEGNGITGLRDRVAAAGGSLIVASLDAPESGTELVVSL